MRDYLSGKRAPGVRARPGPDPFDPFVDYVTARLTEDPHLWARTLFDELEQEAEVMRRGVGYLSRDASPK